MPNNAKAQRALGDDLKSSSSESEEESTSDLGDDAGNATGKKKQKKGSLVRRRIKSVRLGRKETIDLEDDFLASPGDMGKSPHASIREEDNETAAAKQQSPQSPVSRYTPAARSHVNSANGDDEPKIAESGAYQTVKLRTGAPRSLIIPQVRPEHTDRGAKAVVKLVITSLCVPGDPAEATALEFKVHFNDVRDRPNNLSRKSLVIDPPTGHHVTYSNPVALSGVEIIWTSKQHPKDVALQVGDAKIPVRNHASWYWIGSTEHHKDIFAFCILSAQKDIVAAPPSKDVANTNLNRFVLFLRFRRVTLSEIDTLEVNLGWSKIAANSLHALRLCKLPLEWPSTIGRLDFKGEKTPKALSLDTVCHAAHQSMFGSSLTLAELLDELLNSRLAAEFGYIGRVISLSIENNEGAIEWVKQTSG